MSGEVGHFEIPADDPERARKFYATAFGWKLRVIPELDYTMVSTGTVDEQGRPKNPGFIGGGIVGRGELEHTTVTIAVDDISTSEKTIEHHGGKIVVRNQAIGDGTRGHMGYFKDSEGNIIGLYQAPKGAPNA